MTNSPDTTVREAGRTSGADLSIPTDPGAPWYAIRTTGSGSNPPASWSSFTQLEVGGDSDIVTVGAATAGPRLHAAVGTTPGDAFYWSAREEWLTPPTWIQPFSASGTTNDPSGVSDLAIAVAGQDLHAFAMTESTICHSIRAQQSQAGSGGPAWSGWGDLENQAGNIKSPTGAAAAAAGVEVHLCAVTAAGKLLHTIRHGVGGPGVNQAGGYWSLWEDVLAETQTGPDQATAAAAAADGSELHVVLLGNDEQLYHTVRYANGTWDDCGPVPTIEGTTASVDGVSATIGLGSLYVCATAGGDAYLTAYDLSAATWSDGYESVKFEASDIGDISDIAIAGDGHQLHVLAVAPSGDG